VPELLETLYSWQAKIITAWTPFDASVPNKRPKGFHGGVLRTRIYEDPNMTQRGPYCG